MTEEKRSFPLDGGINVWATQKADPQMAVLTSIAISLKRIADRLDRDAAGRYRSGG